VGFPFETILHAVIQNRVERPFVYAVANRQVVLHDAGLVGRRRRRLWWRRLLCMS